MNILVPFKIIGAILITVITVGAIALGIFISKISKEDMKKLVDEAKEKAKEQTEKAKEQAGKVKDAASKEDVIEKIKNLSSLKEEGIITEEEFNSKKQELLSKV